MLLDRANRSFLALLGIALVPYGLWGFGALFMLAFWGLVIGGAIYLIRLLVGRELACGARVGTTLRRW